MQVKWDSIQKQREFKKQSKATAAQPSTYAVKSEAREGLKNDSKVSRKKRKRGKKTDRLFDA